jgi:hypothetical protein
MADRLLLIGATGIFAPLLAMLVAHGQAVVAVGRRPKALRRAPVGCPIVADTTTAEGAAAVIACGPYDGAVVYRPAVERATLPPLLTAVRGRAVLVVTSVAADPRTGHGPDEIADALRPRPGDAVLALGWRKEPPGWHTAEEISRAAQEVLASGEDEVLGALRPWDARPG